MIWIKASERLPTKPGKYFCRKMSTGENVIARLTGEIGKQSIFHRRKYDLIWLDESDDSIRPELIEFLRWYNGYSQSLDITEKSIDDWLYVRKRLLTRNTADK